MKIKHQTWGSTSSQKHQCLRTRIEPFGAVHSAKPRHTSSQADSLGRPHCTQLLGPHKNGASVAPMNFQNPVGLCHVPSKLCLSSSPSPKGVEISWHTKWKFLLEDPWVHSNATLHFLGVKLQFDWGFILDLPCFAICFEQHLILSSRHPEHHTLEPPRGMGSGPQDPGL